MVGFLSGSVWYDDVENGSSNFGGPRKNGSTRMSGN